MTIKAWREVATPHSDVLKGTFQESEFAADITQVHQGKAKPEYQDAAQFYARTFVTEGMHLLLDSVVKRLAGQGGDPVIQLQTAFGGGKTHTMLAVYHLAKGETPVKELQGMGTILDEAGVTALPKARVAVIDGINFSVSDPKAHGKTQCHTLWGELAWQLDGAAGYELVRGADEKGTAPDKDTLVKLLSQAAPCVILVDELVAFLRQFQEGQHYSAGSIESNMTFVQALTEGLKSVPTAILLASLPDSHNAGEGRGRAVLEEVERYFRRIQKIWKPVTKEEAFSIVRRRLFDDITDQKAVETTCRAFADYYVANSADLPPDTQEGAYFDRMKQAYPIHPEIFDRLYDDWATLPNFQRTRGVLQLVAQLIHRLWKDGNADALIMPGNLALFDANVRNKCLDYLQNGWEPVIEQDVDGESSRPAHIESKDSRFGQIQAARRVTRAIFLGSAPGTGAKLVRGVQLDDILLGVAQPGQTMGHYKDVVARLRDQLNYLNAENNRYWFDITPNLRQEMDGRKQRFSDQEDVIPLMRKVVQATFKTKGCFAGVHAFVPSVDVPDEYGAGPRLVILSPSAPYSSSAASAAIDVASEILQKRGEQPRQRQNRLIFLAADQNAKMRAMDVARTCLAWESIVSDIRDEKLVLDTIQAKQAPKHLEGARQQLARMVRETYKWILVPRQDIEKGKPKVEWETATLSATSPDPVDELERKLKEEEWITTDWSPVHLVTLLQKYYFKEGTDVVSAQKVFEDCGQYLYLPRLVDQEVFTRTLSAAIQSEDFFGYAQGLDGDKFLGFVFGENTTVFLDGESVLIEKNLALTYKASLTPPAPTPDPGPTPIPGGGTPPTGGGTGTPGGSGGTGPTGGTGGTTSAGTKKKRFYGNIEMNPVKAKLDFATIMDEVIHHFNLQPDADVTIRIDIEASSASGFDANLQRTVGENCRTLKFGAAEFEEE